MSTLKKLAGDTMIYGLPSILGRFLNLLLTPLYTWIFLPGEYGILGNLLAYVAIFQVIITYGMETSYFRFASRSNKPDDVFSTALISLVSSSALFLVIILLFSRKFSIWVGYPDHHEFIVWMGITVAIDAVTSIPFAQLRLQSRALRFASIKMLNIFFNIILNLFWILLCPYITKKFPTILIDTLFDPRIGIGYAFLSYLISSILTLILLLPAFNLRNMVFRFSILKEMLAYGWPILVIGIFGMVNMNIDKILIPILMSNAQDPMRELGIYSANGKLAILMTLFIQAFRYSFEPFLFSHYKNEDSKNVYRVVMNYFVILGLLIFLGVLFYIEILKYFIGSTTSGYHEGMQIVPWMLMGNLFLGIFYTQSLWYKLTDRTHFGATFSFIGTVVVLFVNIVFVPKIGYLASAIAFFSSSLLMTIISYFYGQKHFPVKYDLKKIGFYFFLSLILFTVEKFISFQSQFGDYIFKTVLIIIFLFSVYVMERSELNKVLKNKIV